MAPYCLISLLPIPKIWNKYSQKRNCAATGPISTFMCLWAIYTYIPTIDLLICCMKYVDRSWEYISRSQTHQCGNWVGGRTVPRKEIHKRDFRCSADGTHTWRPTYKEIWNKYCIFLDKKTFIFSLEKRSVSVAVSAVSAASSGERGGDLNRDTLYVRRFRWGTFKNSCRPPVQYTIQVI